MIAHEIYNNTLEVNLDCGKGNLLSLAHLRELGELLVHAENDGQTHGMIITGTNRSFSTGLDIPTANRSSAGYPWRETFRALDELLVRLFQFQKPFVAAINGHSIGAGFLIQLCSDYAVIGSSNHIKLGLPELSLGLTLDSVMVHLTRHGFPCAHSLQHYLYSSELFGPEKALQMGLVDEISTTDSPMAGARRAVARLAAINHAAFRSTKQTLRRESVRKMEQALAANSHYVFDALLDQSRLGGPV